MGPPTQKIFRRDCSVREMAQCLYGSCNTSTLDCAIFRGPFGRGLVGPGSREISGEYYSLWMPFSGTLECQVMNFSVIFKQMYSFSQCCLASRWLCLSRA